MVNGVSPRTNFDTMWTSATSVFVVFIGDGWDNVMYDYVRIYNVQAGSILYFISLMLIGNLILIRLFSAILLKNFESEAEEAPENETNEEMSSSSKKVFKYYKNVVGMLNRYLIRHGVTPGNWKKRKNMIDVESSNKSKNNSEQRMLDD